MDFPRFSIISILTLFEFNFFEVLRDTSSLDSHWVLKQLTRMIENTPFFNVIQSYLNIFALAIFLIFVNFGSFAKISKLSDCFQICYIGEVGHSEQESVKPFSKLKFGNFLLNFPNLWPFFTRARDLFGFTLRDQLHDPWSYGRLAN